ncbi:MAG TPA: V-type ATP synthase subunit K [Synergistaceae bacterium]|nr:V-type ATP synthase subunit K [Synergistaceae bacterium]HQK24814.1 V-type ATP synthase subunit K [Synergistaceae bacterium]
MEQITGTMLAVLGAALAAGWSASGSAIGIGIAGESGAGVMTEDPGKFGLVLLLQALPGTQGIYGLLTAFFAIMKVGLLGGEPVAVSLWQGLGILFACLPVAIGEYTSGIAQGKTSAASIQMIAKRPEEMGKAIIMPAMVETYAVLSLLMSIILLNSIKI